VRWDRILALVLILVCLLAALGNWLGGNTPEAKTAGDRLKPGAKADIALLEVYGTISDEPTTSPFSSPDSSNSNTLIKSIRQARKDDVKAILLHINSPGGTAAASQAVYDELMRVRQETGIKLVASLGDVAASGGYYIASAADHIVANPSSITGSIGVIVRTQNISGLLDKIGVETSTIQSGQYKDILSPFRQTKADERALLQAIVMGSYQDFLNAVAAGRKISLDQLRPLADGRIFTGEQAQQVKLVDSLGNYYDALRKAADVAGIKGEPSVRNYSVSSWQESLNTFFSSSLEQLIPGYGEIQLARWQKIPLALWE
jgi:protease-4